MKKTWRKSSEALVERFSQAVPPDPRIERRQMFGYPAAFAGGNLFMSLFEESMIFRLSEPAPSGAIVRRRSPALRADAGTGRCALEYALSLPPKKSKAAPTRKKTSGAKPSKSRPSKSKRKARA